MICDPEEEGAQPILHRDSSGNAVKRDLLTGDVSKAGDTETDSPGFLTTSVSKPLLTGDVSKSTELDREILTFLTTYVSKKYLETGIHPQPFLTSLVSILRKPVALDILSFFIIQGAATVNVLREEFPGYSEVSIYRTLVFLESRGLVVKTGRVKTEGRRARVYALQGYAHEDLMLAIERDHIARTPAYAEVNRVIQLLLDDHLVRISHSDPVRGRLYRSEMFSIIKRENRGFAVGDFIDMVFDGLRKQGWKVL